MSVAEKVAQVTESYQIRDLHCKEIEKALWKRSGECVFAIFQNISSFFKQPLFSSCNLSTTHSYIKNYVSVDKMYGADDLSSCPLFKGGYINFGYWDGIDIKSKSKLSDQERLSTEKQLYHQLFNRGDIHNVDKVLEVGSGLGFGCVMAVTDYGIKEVTGLDLSQDQIDRARTIHAPMFHSSESIKFIQGSAEQMPLPDQTYDAVTSVEAAQHFRDVNTFLSEAYRVLKPDGKLAITTFFATSLDSISRLKEYIPTIRDGIDNVVPIEQIRQQLEKLGFRDINIRSIGDNVWVGFDKWISQGALADTWDRNWLVSYKNHLIDYYVITAKK